MPTARKAPALAHALELSVQLGCTLVALCSQWSIATDVVKLARPYRVQTLVIDVPRLPLNVLPRFDTCKSLEGTRFRRATDTSQKRNLGLLLAQLCGWQRVVFLDDDIEIPTATDLTVAAGLTDRYAGVGIAIDAEAVDSFPDNSVVCHAYRDVGGDQGMFVGGGALAVGIDPMNSFFPNIYNEDWFFLLGEHTLRPVTMVGRALQRPYDPYVNGRRAQSEELGDCLAEGLFWLLDTGGSITDANELFWRQFLRRRLEFIAEVVGMVNVMKGDHAKRLKMLAALKAARDRSYRITPELCTRYVSLWQSDRVLWRDHLEDFQTRHRATNVEKVLASLGLMGQSRFLTSS